MSDYDVEELIAECSSLRSEVDALREKLADYTDACRQKQEIIGSWDGDRRYMQDRILELQAERDRYREALEKIVEYARAISPGPVHHVTWNAVTIAEEALGETK